MALVQSRSLPACPRKWARPSELWALCRNCSRHHTKARLMPQTCRSLLLCSGWIQCSIRSGMIRAFRNSARKKRTEYDNAGPAYRCSSAFLQRGRISEQDPFDNGYRQTAVFDQIIVELTEPEVFALSVLVTAEQIHDLPFAGDVADLLRWAGSCACGFALRCLTIQSACVHEIFDGLLKTPSPGVQIHINSNASCTIAGQTQDLSLCR